MRVLDLFSGIGGFSLGLERAGGFKTVAFCEIDPYCRAVLRKHWPNVPQFDDIRKLTAADIEEPIDLICGGYPCQPFSVAGNRLGAADDRHLWPEYFRLIQELRPTWVVGENVVGHIGMGLDGVLSDLEGAGYSVRTFVIPAVAVDAKHRRERTWVVAHSERKRSSTGAARQPWGTLHNINRDGSQKERGWVELESWTPCDGKTLADSDGAGLQGRFCEVLRQCEGERPFGSCDPSGFGCAWLPEPAVGRVAHGIPNRVDRLRCLGNSIVPQIPEIIGRAIMQAEGMTCA